MLAPHCEAYNRPGDPFALGLTPPVLPMTIRRTGPAAESRRFPKSVIISLVHA
jgi:hypothetical protein